MAFIKCSGGGMNPPRALYKNKGAGGSALSLAIPNLNGSGTLDFYTTSYEHDSGSTFSLSTTGTITLSSKKVNIRGGMLSHTTITFSDAVDATVTYKTTSYTGRTGVIVLVTTEDGQIIYE